MLGSCFHELSTYPRFGALCNIDSCFFVLYLRLLSLSEVSVTLWSLVGSAVAIGGSPNSKVQLSSNKP